MKTFGGEIEYGRVSVPGQTSESTEEQWGVKCLSPEETFCVTTLLGLRDGTGGGDRRRRPVYRKETESQVPRHRPSSDRTSKSRNWFLSRVSVSGLRLHCNCRFIRFVSRILVSRTVSVLLVHPSVSPVPPLYLLGTPDTGTGRPFRLSDPL